MWHAGYDGLETRREVRCEEKCGISPIHREQILEILVTFQLYFVLFFITSNISIIASASSSLSISAAR